MIGGLETIEHKFLEKEAMGGSQESNLHSLIQTQAYDNLVEKFPELTSIVLGVSIIETIDEKFEQSTFVKPFKIVFDVSKFDTDEITAKVKHGILKVTVPKQTKKITKSVKWLNK